jgi:Asp-tRNA(Asn)/Glu-tRNA(Gln) amidotransferase A subunit family amidase
VYGLKSSDFRLSNNYSTDFPTTFVGMDTLHVVIGPLSNSVEGLALWMKTATNLENFKGHHDAYHKNIPFDVKTYKEYQTKKKLRIGYLKSLELLESTKASQRAVEETVKLIESLGH